jgi:hypothetical protein
MKSGHGDGEGLMWFCTEVQASGSSGSKEHGGGGLAHPGKEQVP